MHPTKPIAPARPSGFRSGASRGRARGMMACLGALAFSALGLTGCKSEGKEGEAAAAETATTENPATLKIWIMPNSPRPQEDLERVIAGFESAHPEYKVEVSVIDWGSAWTKVTTAAIAGDGPDLVQLGTTWTSSLTDMGALKPLKELSDKLKVRDIFLPATFEAMQPRVAATATSLPWFLDVRPIYYRKDVFEKAKIDPASVQTWADLEGAWKAIQQAKIRHQGKPVDPVGFPGKNDWNVVHNFAPWIWGAGGDFLSEAGDACALNSEAALKGIFTYLDFVRKGYNPKTNLEKNTAQISADFDAGRLATLFETTTKNVYMNLPPEQGGIGNSPVAKNYGVMLPPAGPEGRAVFMGGSHLAIFNATKNPKGAELLLSYLCAGTEAQLAYSRTSGFLPALKAAYDDPYFTGDEKRKVFKELVQYGRIYPGVPYWGEIETSILTKRLGNLFDIAAEVHAPYSEKAVRDEIDATVREIDAVIGAHFQNNPTHKELLQKAVAHSSGDN